MREHPFSTGFGYTGVVSSRRKFVGTVAYGLAGTIAAGSAKAGSLEPVRLGLIGAGDRGTQLLHHIRSCAAAEVVAVADAYAGRLAVAKSSLDNAAGYADYRNLLDRKDIDAVVIATPQHLHAQQFCDALAAGKHIYLEKNAALTLEQADQMRAAVERDDDRHTVQIGHQACSSGHASDVRRFLGDTERMGEITALQMHMFRNTPRSKPQWARPALLTPDLNEATVDWDAFEDPAGTGREFDPNRFVHWRYFWDYAGGSITEFLSQQLAFWYQALDLDIPEEVTATGGILLWSDGREVPDTMQVSLKHRTPADSGAGMLISWSSGFGNNHLGVGETLLGSNGSISRASQVRYTPQKVNRPDLKEIVGQTPHAPQSHMEDFLAALRSDGQPSCPFELGYRVSIACQMAIRSYREQRTVRWNSDFSEIV